MKTQSTGGAIRVAVSRDADIVSARQQGRTLAHRLGLSPGMATLVATAVSELARNILLYAGHGEVSFRLLDDGTRRGIEIVASDSGPGIPDPSRAMEDGFSTTGRLGLGLPGVRRLMDEFDLQSGPGLGTTVRVRKWAR